MTSKELAKIGLSLWGLLFFPLLYPFLCLIDFIIEAVMNWLTKPR